uniref:O-acyltransferase WSD1 C-terminal domain-containing protein n=1 Tax=Salix viminalis TaxID=40686 RepID=A0A6N2KVW3_SALVM
MVKPKAESPWGNHFAFLHVQLPELVASTEKAQQIIKRKRSSLAVYLTAAFIEIVKKLKGHEQLFHQNFQLRYSPTDSFCTSSKPEIMA